MTNTLVWYLVRGKAKDVVHVGDSILALSGALAHTAWCRKKTAVVSLFALFRPLYDTRQPCLPFWHSSWPHRRFTQPVRFVCSPTRLTQTRSFFRPIPTLGLRVGPLGDCEKRRQGHPRNSKRTTMHVSKLSFSLVGFLIPDRDNFSCSIRS